MTTGAIYALSAIGFTLIFNASKIVNFAQGEFIMLGGMLTFFFLQIELPLAWAVLLAILLPAVIGTLIQRFAIDLAKGADDVVLVIITIGAATFIRGIIKVWLGKNAHSLPPLLDNAPIEVFGASILPQSLCILAITAVLVVALWYLFGRTMTGKAMLATSFNRTVAQLVGINTGGVQVASFAASAALGALGGVLITPIALTAYDVGIMLGLKAFVAAVVGGLGNGRGAIIGGLLVGISEAMVSGYISSAYKDAIPFILILAILFFKPSGIFGAKSAERV